MIKLCLCKNDMNDTYHLYKCKTKIDGGCAFTSNKHSNCNQVMRSEANCISKCKNENDMRVEIAKLANQGKQICGICVATLYKNLV